MDIPGRIAQARLIARELWALMRDDASQRLGIAQSMPQVNDRDWSPDFYRRCQLAERLFSILDEIAVHDGPGGGRAGAGDAPEAITQAEAPAGRLSRRRLGV